MPKAIRFWVFIVLLFFTVIPSLFAQLEERGIELYEAKRYQDAADLLRDAVSASPDNLEAHFYLGLSLLELQKNAEAESELHRAAEIRQRLEEKPRTPEESQLELALARAYMGQKKYDDARAHLESARKLDPSSPDVFLYSGKLYVERKDYPSAVRELEKAISLGPKSPYAHYYAGIAYSNTGKPDKMVEEFQLFLKLAPDAPEATKVRSLLKGLR